MPTTSIARLLQQRRRHRRIDAARHGADHTHGGRVSCNADRLANAIDKGLSDHVVQAPLMPAKAGIPLAAAKAGFRLSPE